MGLLDRLRRLLGSDDEADHGSPADTARDTRTAGERTTPVDRSSSTGTGPGADDGPGASGRPGTTVDHDPAASGETPDTSTDAGDAGRDDGAADDGGARTTDAGRVGEAPVAEAVGDDPAAFREQAEELAAFWDDYELDFSPASLARLDELLADQSGETGRMRIELDDGRTATVVPIAASTACYFASVLVRSYGAAWVEDEDYRWAVAVETPDGGEVRLNPFGIAHDGVSDAPRFAVTHDALVVEVGLDGDPVADPQAEAAAGGDGVTDAEALERVADDDPEVAMAAAAAGIDAEEVTSGFREDAADLVDAWPSYDLDYTPASLERLDALVGMELADDDFADADFGGADDETSLLFTVRTMQCAGYLARVFREHAGATWDTDDGVALSLSGPDGTATVEPLHVAGDALREDTSLAAAYADVVSRLGITDAGVEIDPDAPEFASEVDAEDAAHVDDAVAALEDTPEAGDGVSVDMEVDADDVDSALDTDDLDVDVAPGARSEADGDDDASGEDESADDAGE